MVTINFTQARASLSEVLDRVEADHDCTIITRRDAADAVVMSADYYNQLMETVHLLKSPANAAHLAKSIAQHRAGDTSEQSLITE